MSGGDGATGGGRMLVFSRNIFQVSVISWVKAEVLVRIPTLAEKQAQVWSGSGMVTVLM